MVKNTGLYARPLVVLRYDIHYVSYRPKDKELIVCNVLYAVVNWFPEKRLGVPSG